MLIPKFKKSIIDYVVYLPQESQISCYDCIMPTMVNLTLMDYGTSQLRRKRQSSSESESDMEFDDSDKEVVRSISVCRQKDDDSDVMIEEAEETPMQDNKCTKANHNKLQISINEFNVLSPNTLDKNEFVELKAYGSLAKTTSLQGYKIFLIKGIENNFASKNPSISLVIDLWNERFTKLRHKLFVIGGEGVTDKDMGPDATTFYSKEKAGKGRMGQRSVFNFFTDANTFESPVAIALIFDNVRRKTDPSFKITPQEPFIKVDTKVKEYIQRNLVDMVVYGTTTRTDRCLIFEELVPQWVTPIRQSYILRDVNLQSPGGIGETDLSLNFCAETLSRTFSPQYFKLGSPTPGKPNDCTGPKFQLEGNLDPKYLPIRTQKRYAEVLLEDVHPSTSCEPFAEMPSVMATITKENSQELLSDAIQQSKRSKCTNKEGELLDSGDVDISIEEMNTRIRKHGDKSVNYWETTIHFKKEWIDFMSQHQGDKVPIKLIQHSREDIQKWFEYLPNDTSPTESKYRCRLCYNHWKESGLSTNHRSTLATKEGKAWRESLRKNRQDLHAHSNQISHLQVVNFLKRKSLKEMKSQLEQSEKRFNDDTCGIYRVTANMFRIVYTETKLNIPLLHHKSIIELIQACGGSVGRHHYERTSAIRISKFISSNMHEMFTKHIKASTTPWSLIVDGSTDTNQNHYLVVLMQGIEDNFPKVYFYRLLKIGDDETAKGLLNLLLDAFNEDGIYEAMRLNLIGYASDGAAVMMGKKNGLGKKLNDFAKNPLIEHHCLAHRLHLAIRRAFTAKPELKFMFHLESMLNSLYSFYYGSGHKRKAHLMKLAKDSPISDLNYIFEVRWIASEKRAVEKVLKGYEVFFEDLQEIKDSEDFDDKTRSKAAGLFKLLENKNIFIVLNFLLDILDNLAFYSEMFQRRHGLMIEQADNINDLISSIQLIGGTDGHYLKTALEKMDCNGEKCQTVSKFESCDEVKYGTIILKKVNKRSKGGIVYPDLSSVRHHFIKSLEDELISYLPNEKMADYKIFDQRKWPEDERSIFNFRTKEIRTLWEKHGMKESTGIDSHDIIEPWRKMLIDITAGQNWCKFKNAEVINFWHFYLNRAEVPFPLAKLIKTILAIPIGSADAERSFSILFPH